MSDPRYLVDDPKIREQMEKIGRFIRSGLPEGWGFTLFLISYGQGGATFYLSSIRRDDMIKALEEFIAKVRAES